MSSSSHTYGVSESQTKQEAYGGGEEKTVMVIVEDYSPKGGTCLTWAGVHYKTFDGKIYRYEEIYLFINSANTIYWSSGIA